MSPVMQCRNRNLIDYFTGVSFDPTGAAVVAYTDDHNDFDGHTYVTRQLSGPRSPRGLNDRSEPGRGPRTFGPASLGGERRRTCRLPV